MQFLKISIVMMYVNIVMVTCHPRSQGSDFVEGRTSDFSSVGDFRGDISDISDEEDYRYEFSYKVDEKDEDSNKVDFGHREERSSGGTTSGVYYVLLPDGRTQTVTYIVDGDSGFVARVDYS